MTQSEPTEAQRFWLKVDGNRFAVFANGELVLEVIDDTFKDAGTTALFVSSGPQSGFEITFDGFDLYGLAP